MRVLKSKFVRVFLVLVLVLSFSISSAFAAHSSIIVDYSEPPADTNNGYFTILTNSGSIYTYFWNTTPYASNGSGVVNVTISGDTIRLEVTSLGSGSISYNITGRSSVNLWLMGSGATSSSVTFTDTWSGGISAFTYGGNVGYISAPNPSSSLDVLWGTDSSQYNYVSAIYSLLGSLDSRVQVGVSVLQSSLAILEDIALNTDLTQNRVNNLYLFITEYLQKWDNTSLDESTSPLPNQGLNDFESSQGSLRNDSDVSSSLDDVFNDVDFGSFSNGFTVVWDLVDGVLNSHPIFFALVILVLSLGLLNLIFNRR